MSFFGGVTASSSTTVVPASAEKDTEVADPPNDSISSMSFASVADYLAVGSWDNNVSHWLLISVSFPRSSPTCIT
jgi:mRNA export factor